MFLLRLPVPKARLQCAHYVLNGGLVQMENCMVGGTMSMIYWGRTKQLEDTRQQSRLQ